MAKEENDDEAAFKLATNGHTDSDGSSDKPPDEPYPLTESPLAELVAEPSEQSPRVRKGPTQLDSDAKQTYLKTVAEKNAERRFSDALKNIPAQESIPMGDVETGEEGIESQRTMDEPFLLTESPLAEITGDATEGSPKVRKGLPLHDSGTKKSSVPQLRLAEQRAERRISDTLKKIPAKEEIPEAEEKDCGIEPKSEESDETGFVAANNRENEKAGLEDGEQDTEAETVVGGGGENPAKIVWKLPPEENNKKKKKKSKNKKK